MLDLGKNQFSPPVSPAGEFTAGSLLERLSVHESKRLIFSYEGRDVLPGYHVTEVKDAVFNAIDCGGNPEQWRETFIQLWDVPSENGEGHMPVDRFLAIMRKVREQLPFDAGAKLTFEVSDGQSAIKLFRAESFLADDETVSVRLLRRPASCKPRDRWLEPEKAKSCCSGA